MLLHNAQIVDASLFYLENCQKKNIYNFCFQFLISISPPLDKILEKILSKLKFYILLLRGTRGVLEGYLRDTRGILEGYSWDTRGVL